MSREAMQQALEALEKATRFMSDSDYKKLNQAIDDLRAALAKPEQEPVAYWHSEFLKYNTTPEQPAQPEQEPQTTHWEGCEAVHPECRKPDTDCHAQGICQRSGYSIAPTPRKESTDES